MRRNEVMRDVIGTGRNVAVRVTLGPYFCMQSNQFCAVHDRPTICAVQHKQESYATPRRKMHPPVAYAGCSLYNA